MSSAPACSVNVRFCPNRGRGGGGFGGGGVVAAAFGDVQVAGVFEGRDDGGADGGQVDRSAAGTAGGGVFAEGHVPENGCGGAPRWTTARGPGGPGPARWPRRWPGW